MKKIISFSCLIFLLLPICLFLLSASDFVIQPNIGVHLQGTELTEWINSNFTEETPYTEKSEYTFAFIGDTQYVTYTDFRDGTNNLEKTYDWLSRNLENKNVKHVFILGDMTHNSCRNDPSISADSLLKYKTGTKEWEIVKNAVNKIEGKVEYMVVRGNHEDFQINTFFGHKEYRDSLDGTFGTDSGGSKNSIVNAYKLFEIHNDKYLFMTLDFNPSADVITWANNVIKAYPEHKVIITLHAYMDSAATVLRYPADKGSYKTFGGIDGGYIWDNLASKHKNVIMVACGHVSADDIIYNYQTGENGNKVLQLLACPQSLDNQRTYTGLICFMHFYDGGETIKLEYYSPLIGKYKTASFSTTKIDTTIKPVFSVNFDTNSHGEAPDMQLIKKGEKVSAPTAPSANDFEFVGWYKEKSCTTAWDFNTDTIAYDTTLYAKWLEKFSLDFNMNGHGTAPEAQTITDGNKATEPSTPIADGFEFVGWFKDESCTEAWSFDEDTVTDNTTLYAKWLEKFSLDFNMNGHGTAPEAQTITDGNKATEPSTPIADGFEFVGWFKDESCTEAWSFDEDTVTDNTTLYAKWLEKFSLDFNMNGHGTAPEAQAITDGNKATEPATPIADGFEFVGWFKDESCTEAWSFDEDTVTDNTTLYAKWLTKFSLDFNMNGHGTAPEAQAITDGNKATEPATPIADGFEFVGWFKDESCTEAWSFETDTVTENTTLYAKWSKIVIPSVPAPSAPAHSHSYTSVINATHHWVQCSCGSIDQKGEHLDSNKDGSCDVCSYAVSVYTEETTEKVTDEQTTAPVTESVTTQDIPESTAQATDTVITEAQTTENIGFGENTLSDTVEPYESEGTEDNAGCDSLITTPSFALFVIALGMGACTIRKKEE